MKKFMKKIIALMAAFQLFANIPVLGLLNVEAASAYAYQDALIPIQAFATAVAIGSGIVASQSTEAINAASGVIAKAIANVKAKACGDENTAFRVIKNGKSEKPQNGDDKNNNKWFVRGAAAVATGRLVADLTASGQMMEAINNENGYNDTSYKTGIITYNELLNSCSADAIISQLAVYPAGLSAFINFIRQFEKLGYNSNEYFYNVQLYTIENDYYPSVDVVAYPKNSNINYLLVSPNISTSGLSYVTYLRNTPLQFSWWETPSYKLDIGIFYNSDDIIYSIKNCLHLYLPSHASNVSAPDNIDEPKIFNSSTYSGYSSGLRRALFGFIPASKILYELTNNTYKAGQSTETNFPDWVQSSIETINGNLQAINLAINNLQLPQTWGDTQTNIQTGTAPANVINQYINYASNPETVPEPSPDPDPGPNPDPDPDPDPGEQPAAEAAVEESGKDLFDWAIKKVTLPDGFFDKLPFSIPYDIYLLLKSLFPSGKSSVRRVYSVRSAANVGDTDPNGLTISSNYEAAGISTKTHTNKWVKTAPVINLDIHWKYHGVDGSEKTIDIVKKVDLSSISYFAMIVYISIYIFWFFELLSWIMSSFKG